MSAVRIVYRFSDGDQLSVSVDAESSFADALDEARVVALRLYREALGVSVETLAEGDETTE